MQSLPDIPPERTAEAARQLHRAAEHGFHAQPNATTIVEQVLAMLDDPRFAALFAPGSRAEVPIVGRIGGRHAWPARSTGWWSRPTRS